MNHYKSKAHSIYCSTTITAPLIYNRIVVVIEYFCNKFSPLCTLQTVPARRRMRSFGTTMVNSGCGSIEQPLSITTNRWCGAARGTHTHLCVIVARSEPPDPVRGPPGGPHTTHSGLQQSTRKTATGTASEPILHIRLGSATKRHRHQRWRWKHTEQLYSKTQRRKSDD